MTDLTLWRKREIDKLKKDLDILFSQFRRGFGVPQTTLEADEVFAVNLSEGETALTIKAEFPGMAAEDIQVSVTDDTLTLTGKVSEALVDKSGAYERVEKRTRTLTRTVSMPCRVVTDEVKAAFKDGVLTIELPKCKPQAARGIKVDVQSP